MQTEVFLFILKFQNKEEEEEEEEKKRNCDWKSIALCLLPKNPPLCKLNASDEK